ncbi:hypothetical protein [Nostoc sp.]|uniref:hypothetical protein n=1 Tax=Nostoc sp. TaxID=1180 RepID=UPI002FF70706
MLLICYSTQLFLSRFLAIAPGDRATQMLLILEVVTLNLLVAGSNPSSPILSISPQFILA